MGLAFSLLSCRTRFHLASGFVLFQRLESRRYYRVRQSHRRRESEHRKWLTWLTDQHGSKSFTTFTYMHFRRTHVQTVSTESLSELSQYSKSWETRSHTLRARRPLELHSRMFRQFFIKTTGERKNE